MNSSPLMPALPLPFMLLLICAVVIGVLEIALYVVIFGPYFRFGPVVSRQIWRTNASLDEADSAVMAALQNTPRLAFGRRKKAGVVFYSVRKNLSHMSMCPAVTLRIEDAGGGAIIRPTPISGRSGAVGRTRSGDCKANCSSAGSALACCNG